MSSLPDPGGSRAVLIGVYSYHILEDLQAVERNLPGLWEVFSDPALWGLPEANCAVVAQPENPRQVLDALRQASTEATDTLVVYYSGHGLADPYTDELCLTLPDSDPTLPYTTLRYEEIRRIVVDPAVRAARKVVILDCCYSGRALLGGMSAVEQVADQAVVQGTYLLTASAETRKALAPVGEQYTAFTGELIQTLARGITGGPELLDMDTVYRQVRASLLAKSRPLPQQRNRNAGGLIALVRNVASNSRPKEMMARSWGPDMGVVSSVGVVSAEISLSESFIDLGIVEHGGELPSERIYVHGGSGGWTVGSREGWLRVIAGEGYFDIVPKPQEGLNRGVVEVRDKATGRVRVLRILAKRVSAGSTLEEGSAKGELFDVLLEGCEPRRKVHAIKHLRLVAGMGLKEAKDLLESRPGIAVRGMDAATATRVASILEAGGIFTRTVPTSGKREGLKLPSIGSLPAIDNLTRDVAVDVVLLSVDRKKKASVDLLRQVTGKDLAQVVDLINTLPTAVKTGIDGEAAKLLAWQLRFIGAQVRLVEHGSH